MTIKYWISLLSILDMRHLEGSKRLFLANNLIMKYAHKLLEIK